MNLKNLKLDILMEISRHYEINAILKLKFINLKTFLYVNIRQIYDRK